MLRRETLCDVPDRFDKSAISDGSQIIHKELAFELITPMFGGDAESWEINRKNPVRSQSVKGQLRFWWRTMQNETDHKRLLEKESALWGGETANETLKSRVSISIQQQLVEKKSVVEANPKGNALGNNVIPNYVLFPVTELVTKKDKKKSVDIIEELSFSLSISYPREFQDEVINTLTLWTLFGGVGARTRRGTGSLYCSELLKEFQSDKDIKDFLHRINPPQNNVELDYSRVSDAQIFCAEENHSDTQSVWKQLLDSYGKYRQDRRPPKPESKRPGRSYWPEPDAIRDITGKTTDTHGNPVNGENWFPRSAFGLPILTKFGKGDPGNGDTVRLEPNIGTGERYPSPVILKVIKLANGKVIKCALVLNQAFPDRLKLIIDKREYSLKPEQLPFHSANNSKKMNTNFPRFANESIYANLARYLDLEEVK